MGRHDGRACRGDPRGVGAEERGRPKTVTPLWPRRPAKDPRLQQAMAAELTTQVTALMSEQRVRRQQ